MQEKFGMESSKSVNIIVSTRTKLKKAADGNARVDQINYHCASTVFVYENKTWYRACCERCCKFSADPTEERWAAVKRIFDYLNTTRYKGLLCDENEARTSCSRHSDADWAEDLNARKSTSRLVFQISNAAIIRQNKKQSCVALSTAKRNAWRWLVYNTYSNLA